MIEPTTYLGLDNNLKKKMLITFMNKSYGENPEINKVINYICLEYKIEKYKVLSESRKKEYAIIRHIIAYMLRKHFPELILKDIANKITRKDHSTIIHSINYIKDQMYINRKFKEEMKLLSYHIDDLING